MPPEPSPALYRHPLPRYLAATRPAFLSVTLAGALIGLATAQASGLVISPLKALLTVFFALVAHAGANVVNDYHDAVNGSDAANRDRIYPFTGGSRFIQNGLLSLAETRRFGLLLLAAVIPPGLWLTLDSSPWLLAIGVAGLAVAWAYSAPPLQLMSRGWGEGGIIAGWLLVVVGTDFVQRGAFSALPLVAGLPFALLVAAILYINQFPDLAADRAAGKATLVVRLGVRRARWGYWLLILIAHGWLALAIVSGGLPVGGALALLPLPLSVLAGRRLLADAESPARLAPAIRHTVAAANLHGWLLALGLIVAAHG